MSYNLTGVVTNSTTIVGFVQGVNNNLMFGWLGTFFLAGITAVVLMGFYSSTQDVKTSLAGTTFVTFTLSLFLAALDLIPNIALYTTLILCAVVIATTWKKT